MSKRIIQAILLVNIMICFTACNRFEADSIDGGVYNQVTTDQDANSIEESETDDNSSDDLYESYLENEEVVMLDGEEIGIYSYGDDVQYVMMDVDSGNARINALIDDVVKLTDEENVEYSQWVEEGQIYRVAIERIQENPVEYSHLRDYFFIDTDDGINSFEVDYPSKLDINADRYVYDACEFEADYIDVNFDGNKDIVISLGHQGSNGDMVSCAYVYENGEYVYKKSFENIPNYRIDNSEKLIIGTFSSGPYEHVDIKYAYQDGNFIKISEESGIDWE